MDTLLLVKKFETLSILEDRQKELISQLENLLACYRFGKKPSGKLLDNIHENKEKIKKLKEKLE